MQKCIGLEAFTFDGGLMRILMVTMLMFALVQPLRAQTGSTHSTAQEEDEQLFIELKGALKELTALDESDRKLAQSNQIQVETAQMLDRAEDKIRREEIPPLVERGRAADAMRQRIIDSGCPPDGGEVPIAVAERCNPLISAHRAEVQQIEANMTSIRSRMETIQNTRRAVSETTLANTRQQKTNNTRRDELQATKLRLYGQIITRSITIVENRAKASTACEKLGNEEAHCCLSVVWDGADPNRCSIELIYQVFERAGVFATREVRPVR
jgi:DNA repair exonuclease SbcCD ATPase subunit